MGELKKWREQKWVRIGTDGKIKGACGTSKNKKNPDRCLPLAKATNTNCGCEGRRDTLNRLIPYKD